MTLQERIHEKIAQIDALAGDIPGVIIIHRTENGFSQVEYMSPKGLNILGITLDELKAMGTDYFSRYFNTDEAAEYVPKMAEFISRNDIGEVFTLFQQVRRSPQYPWEWYFSSAKILMQNDEGQPLLSITIASSVDPQNHVTHKVNRLLQENNFLRNNYRKFAEISARERDVLKLMVIGKKNQEIARELFIATNTVETHRKNIKRKLGVSTIFELTDYARAFDLI